MQRSIYTKNKAEGCKKLTDYVFLLFYSLNSTNLYQGQETKHKNFNFVQLLSFFCVLMQSSKTRWCMQVSYTPKTTPLLMEIFLFLVWSCVWAMSGKLRPRNCHKMQHALVQIFLLASRAITLCVWLEVYISFCLFTSSFWRPASLAENAVVHRYRKIYLQCDAALCWVAVTSNHLNIRSVWKSLVASWVWLKFECVFSMHLSTVPNTGFSPKWLFPGSWFESPKKEQILGRKVSWEVISTM